MSRPRLKIIALTLIAAPLVIGAATTVCLLRPVDRPFTAIIAGAHNVPVTDRTGAPLSITYQTDWNRADYRRLYDMPPFLVDAFLTSEDRKFYTHSGIDWHARAAALRQNIKNRAVVRGASTITEQTVRMINPRPRSLLSKWLEGWEASLLETRTDKNSILEFYLNQIPYAAGRRGVVQAARYYFDRDLETLSAREILALVILARAPSAYDLYRHPGKIDAPLARLAKSLADTGKITPALYADIGLQTLDPGAPGLPVDARHFARHVKLTGHDGSVRTTLDSTLQSHIQNLLDSRLKRLAPKNVHNAGVFVADHETGEILAWVVAGAQDTQTPGGEIDTVVTPRQPGSALKPFLYAKALEHGWTAATMLNDAPVAEAIGAGLHRFRNYSNTHYGPLTVREALGNSLNIPAILAIHHVGVKNFLTTLHDLGFESLDRDASVYDEGLALGNGEVTLLELATAYTTLANRGLYRPLKSVLNDTAPPSSHVVFSVNTASIISDILSDPAARALEFGSDSILNLPVRTAVKTGTSTDYRDAWAAGFNDRYTVAVWMGNLDRTPMKDVTGSTGPALVLRAAFQHLNANRDTKPLYLSPALVLRDTCTRPPGADSDCATRSELFAPALTQETPPPLKAPKSLELVRPTRGLMIAYDPRIPASHQKFRFELAGLAAGERPEWVLNGISLGQTETPYYLWPVKRGAQSLELIIHPADNGPLRRMSPIPFLVK